MSKKLYIKTYGCQMNVYDSTRMADVLAPLLGEVPRHRVWRMAAQLMVEQQVQQGVEEVVVLVEGNPLSSNSWPGDRMLYSSRGFLAPSRQDYFQVLVGFFLLPLLPRLIKIELLV